MNRWLKILYGILAPLAAVTVALLIASIALLIIDEDPLETYKLMFNFGIYDEGWQWDSIIIAINRAGPLYLSGVAAAIGFRMGLFNIGVNGQYQIAVLVAAVVGAAVVLPSVLHVALIIVVAMLMGAFWAGIAGYLKVKRGINEVISTIMLNYIAASMTAWLLFNFWRRETSATDLAIESPDIPESGLFPDLNGFLDTIGIELQSGRTVFHGFIIIAILVGIGYWFILERTRFGFDLRASGMNPFAARASGVNAQGMILKAMLLSGAVAGLVGLGPLFHTFEQYTVDFPRMLGFDGIAVALLGRNHPVGIGVGALLFGFLIRAAQILDLTGVPREIVGIMQGVIILAAVITYEIVGRMALVQETKALAAAVESKEVTS
jgi:simple sugar transport system permease protein